MPRITSTSCHHRHRIHEVHADDAVRPLGHAGDFGDRNRGGVAGEDGFGRSHLVELAEQLVLEFAVLGNGLDDELGAGRDGQIGGGLNAAQGGFWPRPRSACPF